MISEAKKFEWLKLKNYRLRTKLIITYILLTIVPLSLLGYMSYTQYTKSIEEQVGEYVPRILDQANDNIDKQVEELEHLSGQLYNSSQVLSVLRKDSYTNLSYSNNDSFIVNSYLSRTYFNEKNLHLLGVFVWSKNRLFYSAKLPYTGLQEEPYFRGKANIILQHDTDLSFEGNTPFILIRKEIKDNDNLKNIGMVLFAVQLSFFDNVLNDMKQQNGAEISVINERGNVFYSTDTQKIGSVEDVFNFPITNGSFRSFQNGERKLVSVSQSLQTNWILVHSIPFQNLTKNTELIRKFTIALVIVFVLIIGFISIIVAWSISRPIHKLSRLMRDVEKGNFHVDLLIDSRDEIGILARSFNSMVSKIKSLIEQNYHIELRQKQAELYALQSQINPHFMYNSLETISMAVEEDEKETVVEMVTLMGKMLRFSLSNKDRIVTFNKEVEHIKYYLSIQKYRFEHRLNFHIQSDIDLNRYFTPKFMLQPIVENCIKHGLESRKALTIRIHITKVPGIHAGSEDIIMSVQDDGGGIDRETLEEIEILLQQADSIVRRDSGFGLINVHARVVMMFGPDNGLTIESKAGKGTEVVIRFPVIDNLYSVEKYDRKEAY